MKTPLIYAVFCLCALGLLFWTNRRTERMLKAALEQITENASRPVMPLTGPN